MGLVTYPGTRFVDAATDEGLLSRTVKATAAAGLTVASMVSDEDALEPEAIRLDVGSVRASIRAELDTEVRWREHLAGGDRRRWPSAVSRVRSVWRMARFAPPWQRVCEDDRGSRMLRRLANIELSHIRLIDAALVSGARWVLIVEDDAYAEQGERFGHDLAAFTRWADLLPQPLMVSLSESFSLRDLGLVHCVHPVSAPGPWTLLAADVAVTNTVCATLYRRSFLMNLRESLSTIPMEPVLPIDFKLNEALMRISAQYRPGDAWLAYPGPLRQRSGVPRVRLI